MFRWKWLRSIPDIVSKNKTVVFVALVAAFLRFFRLSDFVTFLGDQGRDAIIIKRILTFEHLPAIGAPTSIGQVYLGPFYYYFIAPWLFLSRFEPIGLAVGVAFFSSLYVLVNYFIIKEFFGKKVALLSSVLIAFSTTLIGFSRFSWNPNLLPLFTLLTVYFLIKAFKTYKWYFFALTGAFLSFSIQLHYLALFLLPPILVFALSQLFEQKKKMKKIFVGGLIAFTSFLFFSIPLVIFDLRHNFLNTTNFLKLSQGAGAAGGNKLSELLSSFLLLNVYSFNAPIHIVLSTLILILTVILFFVLVKTRDEIRVFLLFFILSIIGLSILGTAKYPHYFTALYPFYFVILAYFLSVLPSSVWGKFLIGLFLAFYIFLNASSYVFFYEPGSKQIAKAKKIADVIYKNTDGKYTVTALPERYSDSTYRYFLEVWGKRPIEKDSTERADILFVVCEEKCPLIIGNPRWDIAYFAPEKIVSQWKIDNVTIYKLTR